jgi:hypothetical protein
MSSGLYEKMYLMGYELACKNKNLIMAYDIRSMYALNEADAYKIHCETNFFAYTVRYLKKDEMFKIACEAGNMEKTKKWYPENSDGIVKQAILSAINKGHYNFVVQLINETPDLLNNLELIRDIVLYAEQLNTWPVNVNKLKSLLPVEELFYMMCRKDIVWEPIENLPEDVIAEGYIWACINNNLDAINKLREPACWQYNNALLHTCENTKNIDVVMLLVSHGADNIELCKVEAEKKNFTTAVRFFESLGF